MLPSIEFVDQKFTKTFTFKKNTRTHMWKENKFLAKDAANANFGIVRNRT